MGAKDVAVHALYEQKIDSKNLHAKKSIFGINVEISKTNAKMEYKYRKNGIQSRNTIGSWGG